MKKKQKLSKTDDDSIVNGISRRDIIKLLTVAGVGALCPVGGILKLVIDNAIQKANATQVISNSRNYVLIDVHGGLPRWLWDSPLTPNGASDLFQANNMVKTNFTSGGSLGFSAEYKTVLKNGYYMPYLWSLQVPNSTGGTRNMDELLQNMLVIRGVNMEVDNHPGDNMKLTQPVPGLFSVSGLAADAGKGLIPAITVATYEGAPLAYQSEKGTGLFTIPVGDANFLTSLFDAFTTKDGASSFRNNTVIKDKIDTAIDIMSQYGKANEHATDPVFQDRKKAEELFRGSLVGLGASDFIALKTKYDTILNRVLTDAKNGAIPGITSIPIPGIKFPLTVAGNNKKLVKFGQDLTDTQLNGNIYNFEGHMIGNSDVKSMFNTAKMTELAKCFAFLEFVLVNRLSNSIVISAINVLQDLNLDNSPQITTLATEVDGLSTTNSGANTIFNIPPANLYSGVKKTLNIDSHATGLVPTLMCFSVFYIGLSACLLELIDKLKVTRYSDDPTDLRDMFSETVIQFGSEFDRQPDHTGAGSQHGWVANTFTYISGGIKKFQLTGNILKGTDYPGGGTWGIGAPVNGVSRNGGAELIRPIHCGNSICTMLRIKSVTTAEASLVNLINDVDIEIIPELELPTNKAG